MARYARGRSPFEESDRLPFIRIKEVSGDYDSYKTGLIPQFKSKNFRGDIYLRSLKVTTRPESTTTFEATWRAETLDWLDSGFLTRDKKWIIVFGWADSKSARDKITSGIESSPEDIVYEASTATIDVKFDAATGGFDLTLVMFSDELHKAYDIQINNSAIQLGIGTNISNLTFDNLLTSYLGELKVKYKIEYKYSDSRSDPDARSLVFNELWAKHLQIDTSKPFLTVLNQLINVEGYRLRFDHKTKELFIIKNDYVENTIKPKWLYEYKTYNTEILDLDIELFIDGTTTNKRTEREYVLRNTGAVETEEQVFKGFTEFKNDAEDTIEIYSPGEDTSSYVFSKGDYTRIPIRKATLTVIGNPEVELMDKAEIRGVGSLSGEYLVTHVEHELTPGNYKTVMNLIGSAEVIKNEAVTEEEPA